MITCSLVIITNLLFGLDPFVWTFDESFSCNFVLYMHANLPSDIYKLYVNIWISWRWAIVTSISSLIVVKIWWVSRYCCHGTRVWPTACLVLVKFGILELASWYCMHAMHVGALAHQTIFLQIFLRKLAQSWNNRIRDDPLSVLEFV